MNVLFILGMLIAFSQASDVMSKVTEAIDVCAQEKGMDIEKIKELIKTTLPEDDEEFNAFFSCYYTKIGFLKDDGTLDLEHIHSTFPQWIKHSYPEADANKLSQDVMEHCEDVVKEHKGIKAGIKLRNCILQYLKDHEK